MDVCCASVASGTVSISINGKKGCFGLSWSLHSFHSYFVGFYFWHLQEPVHTTLASSPLLSSRLLCAGWGSRRDFPCQLAAFCPCAAAYPECFNLATSFGGCCWHCSHYEWPLPAWWQTVLHCYIWSQCHVVLKREFARFIRQTKTAVCYFNQLLLSYKY